MNLALSIPSVNMQMQVRSGIRTCKLTDTVGVILPAHSRIGGMMDIMCIDGTTFEEKQRILRASVVLEVNLQPNVISLLCNF
jgi:hypothetical protein